MASRRPPACAPASRVLRISSPAARGIEVTLAFEEYNGKTRLKVQYLNPFGSTGTGGVPGLVSTPGMISAVTVVGLAAVAFCRSNRRVFSAGVAPLSAFERQQLARLPITETQYRKALGVPRLFGEKGFTFEEQRGARPTVEINGLTSGYQGEGSKTIIPAWASAKLTFRLVPNQDPARIGKVVMAHLKKLCPLTVKMTLTPGHGGEAYLVSPSGAQAQAAQRALREAFGCEPVLMREGGSIPIVTQFKKILGAESLLLGLALPDDNAHSPNEKFSLDAFEKGMRMGAYLWRELGVR